MSHTVTIDVYSDVVCPWCYVGKRRLERALSQVKGDLNPHVTWRPFQLNPTMPLEGLDRIDYLEAKFGSREAFASVEERVVSAGEMEGIRFAFGKIKRTPNTFLAHRLIWHARQLGREDAMVESLFKGYFEEGAEISSIASLLPLADRAGVRADTVLSGGDGIVEVTAEQAVGHRLGIRGVPYFLIDDAYVLSGAQPPERLVAALRAAQSGAAQKVSPSK
ncbi:DSBA oxidoreductase [Nitrospira sp.]|nr:DSBA oxidoreductase [Nitrospira sp.]